MTDEAIQRVKSGHMVAVKHSDSRRHAKTGKLYPDISREFKFERFDGEHLHGRDAAGRAVSVHKSECLYEFVLLDILTPPPAFKL